MTFEFWTSIAAGVTPLFYRYADRSATPVVVTAMPCQTQHALRCFSITSPTSAFVVYSPGVVCRNPVPALSYIARATGNWYQQSPMATGPQFDAGTVWAGEPHRLDWCMRSIFAAVETASVTWNEIPGV